MKEHIVVVGASHAGVAFLDAMRTHGFTGDLTIIDRLPDWPMERPPLSKAFLYDDSTPETYFLRKPEWYKQNNITMRKGQEVTAIDRAGQNVTLHSGEVISYDKLVLATGARARMLPDASGLAGVHVVRDPLDALAIKDAVARSETARSKSARSESAGSKSAKAIVIGGGYIGLETTASLRKMGLSVAVIEAADRLLARVASPQISQFFADLHKAQDVQLHIGAQIASIDQKDGAFSGVTLGDGSVLEAEMLIVGIGVTPDMTLPEMAGIDGGNGVAVDLNMQTSDAAIYAIGDGALCAVSAPMVGDMPIRVESVHNAQDSAARAAAAINGHAPPEWQAPWFWSEQYDARLQSAGIVPPQGDDVTAIIRPGKREGGFSCWSFAGDVLHSIEAVRDPAGYMLGKKCLDSGRTPTAAQVNDPDFDIKTFLAG